MIDILRDAGSGESGAAGIEPHCLLSGGADSKVAKRPFKVLRILYKTMNVELRSSFLSNSSFSRCIFINKTHRDTGK